MGVAAGGSELPSLQMASVDGIQAQASNHYGILWTCSPTPAVMNHEIEDSAFPEITWWKENCRRFSWLSWQTEEELKFWHRVHDRLNERQWKHHQKNGSFQSLRLNHPHCGWSIISGKQAYVYIITFCDSDRRHRQGRRREHWPGNMGMWAPGPAPPLRKEPCDSSPWTHPRALICEMRGLEKTIPIALPALFFYDYVNKVQSICVKTVL